MGSEEDQKKSLFEEDHHESVNWTRAPTTSGDGRRTMTIRRKHKRGWSVMRILESLKCTWSQRQTQEEVGVESSRVGPCTTASRVRVDRGSCGGGGPEPAVARAFGGRPTVRRRRSRI
jgi:hypothetical protein